MWKSIVLMPGQLLARYWHGEMPLWSAYWMLGALGGLAVICPAVFLSASVADPLLRFLMRLVPPSIHLVVTAVAVSRCSHNVVWKAWAPLAVGSVALAGAVVAAVWVLVLLRVGA